MRAIGTVVALVLSLGLAAAVSGATTPAATAAVLVQGFSFQPPAVTIAAGGSVTWTLGTDTEQHTVTPRQAGAFEGSGQLFTGDTFTVTFDQPGIVEYFCSLHPTMVGTVEAVDPAGTTTPSALPTASPTGDTEPRPPPAGEAAPDPTLLVVAAVVGLGIIALLALIARRRA